MKRAARVTLTTEKLLKQLNHASLDWPGKTVRLERNSLVDYQQRSTSGRMSIAEFYHENTKLFPEMAPELTASQIATEDFRRQYLQRRAAVARSSGGSILEFDTRSRRLLDAAVASLELETFYAIELRILVAESLGAYDPGAKVIQIVKQVSIADAESLRRALWLLAPPNETPFGGPLLFILGSFARNDILYGPRGYRHTLIEAGRVTQAVLSQAARVRIPVRARYDFIDRDVDSAMGVDGIEQGTLLAVELGEAPDDS